MALGIPLRPPRPRQTPEPPDEPPMGGAGTERAPLGPEPAGGYKPSSRGGYPTRQYREGDQLVVTRFSSERVAEVQRQLEAAGILSKGGYRLGVADIETQEAMAEVMMFANSKRVPWDEGLLMLIQGADASGGLDALGGGGQERAPLVIRQSNPEDLKALHEDVTRTMLGRKPTEAETARFVQSYQTAEVEAQQQAYGLEESGGSFVEPPSAEAAAMSRIRAERPDEAFAHDWADRYEAFASLMAGAGI